MPVNPYRTSSEAEAARLIDLLDRFLANPYQSADAKASLWNVLTALRGPDSNSFSAKAASTAHIRRAAFPFTTAAIDKGAAFPASFSTDSRPFSSYADASAHFNSHINMAQIALQKLGLKVLVG